MVAKPPRWYFNSCHDAGFKRSKRKRRISLRLFDSANRTYRVLLALGQRPCGVFYKRVAGSHVKNVTKGVAMKIVFLYCAAYAREQNNAVATVEVCGIVWAKGIVV